MKTLTDDEMLIVTLAWELGRAYGHTEIADAVEEAEAVPQWLPAPRSWEEQVADRLAEMAGASR